MKLKDEAYFKKQNDKLMKENPIKFMEYVSVEMVRIAQHEGNKKQQLLYSSISSIAQKYK